MDSVNPSPPPPSRQAMYLEFALVCALSWMPFFYSGLGDYLGWRKPSSSPADEVYSVFSALAFSALPIFLIWRNGEPFRKLGFKPFELRDAIVAVVLFLAAIALVLIYRPIEHALVSQPGAVTSYRVHHGFPLPVESFIFLVSAFREEIFCRAYLCLRLRDFGLNRTRTAILSALVFASYHIYEGWAALPVMFFFGLIFAGVFLNYRSLWPLVVAHACYNLLLRFT